MNNVKKIGIVSSYVPRECGVAEYTNFLLGGITKNSYAKSVIIAMNDNKKYKYGNEVVCQIEKDNIQSYISAAKFINKSNIDIVSIQHEFGLYGGPNGNFIFKFVKELKKPLIITLHTVPLVLEKPFRIRARKYRSRIKLLEKILPYVKKVIVMSEIAKDFITNELNYPRNNIYVLNHGVPQISKEEIALRRTKTRHEILKLKDDEILLYSFGLLTSKKGFEYAIRALPEIIEKTDKKVVYLITGEMSKHNKEDYQRKLQNKVIELKLEDSVRFISRYVSNEELISFLSSADIVITPYLIKELTSSGVLSYAIGVRSCLVSTPYIFALEVLKKNSIGRLVKFKDYKSIAKEIIGLIENPKLIEECKKNIDSYNRENNWDKISKNFVEILER